MWDEQDRVSHVFYCAITNQPITAGSGKRQAQQSYNLKLKAGCYEQFIDDMTTYDPPQRDKDLTPELNGIHDVMEVSRNHIVVHHDNQEGYYLELNGKKVAFRIWIGNLFNCSFSLYSLLVIFPCLLSVIFMPIFLKSGPIIEPLNIILFFILIFLLMSVLGWIFGINDLCKLRKKGYVEMNTSMICLDIGLLLAIIINIITLYRDDLFIVALCSIGINLAILFWTNSILYKFHRQWSIHKKLFNAPNSDFIPYIPFATIMIFLYSFLYFGISINPFYWAYKFLDLFF